MRTVYEHLKQNFCSSMQYIETIHPPCQIPSIFFHFLCFKKWIYLKNVVQHFGKFWFWHRSKGTYNSIFTITLVNWNLSKTFIFILLIVTQLGVIFYVCPHKKCKAWVSTTQAKCTCPFVKLQIFMLLSIKLWKGPPWKNMNRLVTHEWTFCC